MNRRLPACLLAWSLAMLPACARQVPAPDAQVEGRAGAVPMPRQSVGEMPDVEGRASVQAGPALDAVLDAARSIAPLRAVAVSRGGRLLGTRGFRGSTVDSPANIKSASKTVLSALAGIAIEKGVLRGTDQRVAEVLERDLPAHPDPRLRELTVGHLLSMQAGLESTSGANYGRWVTSANWVRDALSRPFVDEPGGGMLYSTGSSHLLSAVLVRASGRTTLALARDWLGPQEGFEISAWDRDPQGVHLGGNNMAMSTRSLLAFGELYRNGGLSSDGTRLLAESWIRQSWEPRTESRYTGDGYGYGWFLRELGGHQVRYAWGYGGQMLYVVPGLDLVVAMTSDDSSSSARSGHRDDLHGLLVAIMETARPAD